MIVSLFLMLHQVFQPKQHIFQCMVTIHSDYFPIGNILINERSMRNIIFQRNKESIKIPHSSS